MTFQQLVNKVEEMFPGAEVGFAPDGEIRVYTGHTVCVDGQVRTYAEAIKLAAEQPLVRDGEFV